MKYIALIPLLLVSSCASRQVLVRPIPPGQIEPVGSVRYAEVVRAYHVGRYVDPNHPETINEEHPVYRLEASARWNLHPNTPVGVVLNPPPDAAFAPPPVNDVIVVELNHQREITKQVMQEAVRLAASYQQLQPVITEMKNVAQNNALLHAQLVGAEERLLKLEHEFEKATVSPSSSTNEIPESTDAPKS
jgi:hypothetical protein